MTYSMSRPQSQSEMTPIMINMELTHLDSILGKNKVNKIFSILSLTL